MRDGQTKVRVYAFVLKLIHSFTAGHALPTLHRHAARVQKGQERLRSAEGCETTVSHRQSDCAVSGVEESRIKQ